MTFTTIDEAREYGKAHPEEERDLQDAAHEFDIRGNAQQAIFHLAAAEAAEQAQKEKWK